MSAPSNRTPGTHPGATHDTEQQASQKNSTPASASKRPWRDVIQVHPAADEYPLMPPSELRELATDIKNNGLRTRVDILVDDNTGKWTLLDGRNRLDALELLGRDLLVDGRRLVGEYCLIHKASDGFQHPRAFAKSRNAFRRHLTPEQRRAATAVELRRDPLQSDRAMAKKVGQDHKTVAKERAEAVKRGEIPHVATRKDSKGRDATNEEGEQAGGWSDNGGHNRRGCKRA